MDVDASLPTSINNSHHQFQESEIMETYFAEQLSGTLGEDFPYPLPDENYVTCPKFDFDCDLTGQFVFPQTPNNNNNHNYNKDNDKIHNSNVQEDKQRCVIKEKTKNQATSGGAKKKRQPNQVQDHIIAERRRRELISQLFISLSSIVPGIKKVYSLTFLKFCLLHYNKCDHSAKFYSRCCTKRLIHIKP